MKKLFSFLALSLLLVTTACKTTNPNTGQKEYDPVTTTQVKAALQPAVSDVLRRILVNSPEHATNSIAPYFRQVGGIFCKMVATKQFSPNFLIEELKTVRVPDIGDGASTLAINTAVGLYSIFYVSKHTVDLSEEQWGYHLSDFFCAAIDRGLRDAGHEGIPPVIVAPPPNP